MSAGRTDKNYNTPNVWDRMWKQIGNAVDGRLAKAIGDTFLKATLADLRAQPPKSKTHGHGHGHGEGEAHTEPAADHDGGDGAGGLGAVEPEG